MALLRNAMAAFAAPADAPWQGLDRLLHHVIATWAQQPRHRDPVFERDGWRCAVPGCTARRNLHDHHLLFRSRGGGNRRENRITLCVWHHLHGIHGGVVRAWGRAPDAVRWDVGVAGDQPPLLRTLGDRYLSHEQPTPANLPEKPQRKPGDVSAAAPSGRCAVRAAVLSRAAVLDNPGAHR